MGKSISLIVQKKVVKIVQETLTVFCENRNLVVTISKDKVSFYSPTQTLGVQVDGEQSCINEFLIFLDNYEHVKVLSSKDIRSAKMKWELEPNELRFEHVGLKCLVIRANHLGHLNGYVGMNGIDSTLDSLEAKIDVHGGVTFFQPISNLPDMLSAHFKDCTHVVGFDTAHYSDLVPYFFSKGMQVGDGTYRDMEYVKEQTEKMAEQLKNL